MAVDLDAWVAGLDGLLARIAGRFPAVRSRRRARSYLVGLLAPVERKNSWQLSEVAGDATPDGMQRLLNQAAWDVDGVRDDLRAYAAEHLGAPGGVLIVDETGFVKKGLMSAGVQRQYSGTAGRVENCQLGVFTAYASVRGRALIDRELYLPKSWTSDRDRCRAAGVPEGVEFATKQVLAQRMLARALDAGVPAAWVAADEAYGQDSKFRGFCERRRIGYVVAVPRSQKVTTGMLSQQRIDTIVADAPGRAWKRLSAGDGTKGERLYDWAMARLPGYGDLPGGHERAILARRSITRPDEIAYYLAAAPAPAAIEDLVRVAGTRWAIEECFGSAKNETGLDHYQVRRWNAWYAHTTLALAAHIFLAVTAASTPKAHAAWSASRPPPSDISWHT
nr:IS701 family transposase [Phytomonospora endophytica]